MTCHDRRCTRVPGVEELIGKGVYRGLPVDIPQPVRDGHAVVVDHHGRHADSAAAARALGAAGWVVTLVTRERGGHRHIPRGCRRKAATELVCATGIEYLEVLILRRIGTKRIEACGAAALFLL